MSGSTPGSSRLAALAAIAAAACVDQASHPHETTSLEVTVTSPADLGSPEDRLADSIDEVAVTVSAIDETGRVDTRFTGSVDVYVQTLNALSEQPAKLSISGGMGSGTIALPKVVFGSTYLWIEDVTGESTRIPTYATGTSPTMWFREPFLVDVSTPDLTGTPSTWLRRSPLEGKQVTISASQHGAAGKLVVTGVFADGFSLSDVNCATRPCTASPFAHVYVFSFSRPIDVRRRPVQVGQVIKTVEGGVAEFNGFTELNFPVQELVDETIDESLLPAPVTIRSEWLTSGNEQGQLRMEEQEGGLMAVSDVTVCPLDEDFERFQQWKVNVGLGCGRPINVISASTVAGFDPRAQVGKRLTSVVGAVRGVNLGSVNIWILLPRRAADIVTQ